MSLAKPLYVVDGGDVIEAYDATTGALLSTISGAATGLMQAVDVATDGAGNIYAIDNTAYAIYEYPKGSNGNVAPIRTIALFGTFGDSNVPRSLAVDTANTIYALTQAGTSAEVFLYRPGSSMPDSPYSFLVPAEAKYIRLDGRGNVDVAGAATIDEYTAGSPAQQAHPTPKRALTDATIPTNTTQINGLSVDARQDIVLAVGQSGGVHYFTGSQSGTAMPTITYRNLTFPSGIAFDAAGDIFVGSFGSTMHPLTVFDATTGARRTFSIDVDPVNVAF